MFDNVILFGNSLNNILLVILIVLAGLAGSYLAKKIIDLVVKPFTEKTETDIDDIILEIVETPICFFIALWGIYYAHNLLTLPTGVNAVLDKGYTVAIILMIAYVGIQIVDLIVYKILMNVAKKSGQGWNTEIIPIIRQVVKFTLIAFAILMVFDNFGFNITSILAGLGIGGLAFAFAAKDMIANLFGGISIFMDKPFKQGDAVKLAGIEGNITEVGLRTTRIRTPEGRIVTIPNLKLTDGLIENISSEHARKVTVNLGLTYDTSTKKIERAIAILKEIIKKHPATKKECEVAFNKFGDFSINILFNYWIEDKTKILQTQHEVNMEIKKRFDAEKIEFAFPTQTLIMAKQRK